MENHKNSFHKTSALRNKRKGDEDTGDIPKNAKKLKKIIKNENDLELETLKKQIDQLKSEKDSEIKKLKEQLLENDAKRDLELQKLKEQVEKHHEEQTEKLATEKEKLSDENTELKSRIETLHQATDLSQCSFEHEENDIKIEKDIDKDIKVEENIETNSKTTTDLNKISFSNRNPHKRSMMIFGNLLNSNAEILNWRKVDG